MSTTKNRSLIIKLNMKENPPDPDKIVRGPEARKQRLLEAQKQRITIRLDKEIVGEFKDFKRW